ncbi:hypothetical protein [Novosphingobium huizhouense]|uniref:hypothetical protein n=1 Tax=Novosphingobium huizhouense TaxID=2866625 RepID=UPI001CD8385F|nr:hypothetical protein [Novosphingobium huizhouense]
MSNTKRAAALFRAVPLLAATSLAVLLASCAKAPPPPPPPPPPPKVVVIPPKPMPPNGASDTLEIPPVDAMGLRQSVNRNISPAQALWNLRSAYNVAALNCSAPKHADILVRYRAFLTGNAKVLTATNKAVDAEFRKKFGAKFVPQREAYMTSVYNHFALPPTISDFCDAVLAVSRDGMAVKPADLQGFAVVNLPNIEVVFDDFYRKYEKYRADLAIWQAQYGQSAAAPRGASGGVGSPS